MAFGPRFGLPHDARPYHQRVFRIEELREVVARHGLPPDEAEARYEDYASRPFEKYIEIQLWSDEPVREYLGEPGR